MISAQAGIERATLYATALGTYQVTINGHDVDDQVLKPGWTAYNSRVIHETTDVTALLTPGPNSIGVRLAGGWATEQFGFAQDTLTSYVDQPCFCARLFIEYADGRCQVETTSDSWRASPGPLQASSIYQGETYDARRAIDRSSSLDWDDSEWPNAVVRDCSLPIEARATPGVRRVCELPVAEVITSPSGATILDFGQNIVGRLRLRVRGPAGTVITLRHAEVLEDRELSTRPLRDAAATDSYTLAGHKQETWEPEFTFHGFRYAEVRGWPGKLDPADVVAVVVHSDMDRIGWFACSDPLISKLHDNIVWGMRGNFLYLPTDCPQRDERLGWTGDIQVFSPTAAFLYDVRTFLESWLVDLAREQAASGGVVPLVVPNVALPTIAVAAWGDAATVVPSVLHERYGAVSCLARQYSSMQDWFAVALDRAGSTRLWSGDFQYGDWLDPEAPADTPEAARTDPDIVATAYLYRSARLLATAADLLGNIQDAERYRLLAAEIRSAFCAAYITEDGSLSADTQTAYSLAICFGLAPDHLIARLGERLADLTARSGYHIGTGFVGTPLVLDALTDTGHLEAAQRLLQQTECPSWLYPVTMGATTIWERWDALLPDGTVNPGKMTSFNHYAFGAMGDWLHRRLAGLAPAAPGYSRLNLSPVPLPGIEWASAEHLTPHGRASIRWERHGDELRVSATVPANTTARVVLPHAEPFDVGSGDYRWTARLDPPDPAARSDETTSKAPRTPLDLGSIG